MEPLTYDKFKQDAQNLVKKSDELNDGWTLKVVQDSLGSNSVYLSKILIKPAPNSIEIPSEQFDQEDSTILEDTSEFERDSSVNLVWEFNVVYSLSYSVPVLYFNVSTQSGKLLTHNEVIKCLNLMNVPSESTLRVVSQSEHPLLHAPFFFIHPCSTSQLPAFKSDSNVIVNWLSVVSQIVGHEMLNEYALI